MCVATAAISSVQFLLPCLRVLVDAGATSCCSRHRVRDTARRAPRVLWGRPPRGESVIGDCVFLSPVWQHATWWGRACVGHRASSAGRRGRHWRGRGGRCGYVCMHFHAALQWPPMRVVLARRASRFGAGLLLSNTFSCCVFPWPGHKLTWNTFALLCPRSWMHFHRFATSACCGRAVR